MPADHGLAVGVYYLGGVLGVVLPVAEPSLEGGGADLHPLLFGEVCRLAVGGFHPLRGAFVLGGDGGVLGSGVKRSLTVRT